MASEKNVLHTPFLELMASEKIYSAISLEIPPLNMNVLIYVIFRYKIIFISNLIIFWSNIK